MNKKRIAILGSTGSIGRQALSVVEAHPEEFVAEVLVAGSNASLLAAQARQFKPDAVVIADESKYAELQELLAGDEDIKVYAGEQAVCDVVGLDNIDMVLVAVVGFAGLRPTVSAIEARKPIALANKETLVVAGQVINDLIATYKVPLLPVDSEHSAIFQCIQGENAAEAEKILLTASGGPFLNSTAREIENATVAQALNHPRWNMGAKITIDSATMMNKGFEVIEAKWLFGVSPANIEVLIHPQSIVHSAVQFVDGAVKAQLGIPDMRLPIQYALSYPARLKLNAPRLDLAALGELTFAHPDTNKFPCLALAYDAIRQGGSAPCALNAAGEEANLAFRQERIKFGDIAKVVEATIARTAFHAADTLDSIFATDKEARAKAREIINGLYTCNK